MRALFLPLITRGPATGTICRCLAIADNLRRMGRHSLFLTNGEGAKLVSEAGFRSMRGVIPDPPGPIGDLRDLSDVAVHLNLTKEPYLRHALEAEMRAVDAFKPDVLFSEFKLTAPITAAAVGLPLVSTACSPADPRFVSPLYPRVRTAEHHRAVMGFNRELEARGLPHIDDVAELFFTRSDTKIAPTLPELEPLIADVNNLRYVGCLLYDRRELAPLPEDLFEGLAGDKLVFVYLSSGEIGPKEYTKVLPHAFDGTEFRAVVAVGDHPDLPELPPQTNNVKWVRFVPGRAILEHCQAALFHGGQNTAMASLLHGVPSLVFPGGDFERDFNARSLERIGAAIHLPVEDFTPKKILEGIRRLQNPSFRTAANTYKAKIEASGGAERAAKLLLESARNTG